jgi:exodeoxyribonuclease VIII
MIDFETLSLKENAVLLSLGACVFDPATGEIGQTFYCAIDPRTQPGRDISASTVIWWLGQEQAARDKILESTTAADAIADGAEGDELYEAAALPINHVAMAFNGWIESLGDDVECWSNGAVDHAWLNSMFEYSGFKNPIPFWKQRDYRTLKAMYPDIKADDYGTAHNALDDAIKQAKHLCKIMAFHNERTIGPVEALLDESIEDTLQALADAGITDGVEVKTYGH